MSSKWRPEGWPKYPCDDCTEKQIDGYGYVCDLSCGKRSQWISREAGADAMLESVRNRGVPIEFTPNWRFEDYANSCILALDKVHINKVSKPVKGRLTFIPDEEDDVE